MTRNFIKGQAFDLCLLILVVSGMLFMVGDYSFLRVMSSASCLMLAGMLYVVDKIIYIERHSH